MKGKEHHTAILRESKSDQLAIGKGDQFFPVWENSTMKGGEGTNLIKDEQMWRAWRVICLIKKVERSLVAVVGTAAGVCWVDDIGGGCGRLKSDQGKQRVQVKILMWRRANLPK